MNNAPRKTWRDRLTLRFGAYLVSVGTVTAVAAWNSYIHQYDVARWLHQPMMLALTVPGSIDGMLAVATLAMADDKANGRLPRTWARAAFWVGAVVSIAANIASVAVSLAGTGAPWPVVAGAIAWNAWPPLALLIVVEIMAKPGNPTKNPARVEGGRKAAQTRKTAPAPRKRAPRAPAAVPTSPGMPPLDAYIG